MCVQRFDDSLSSAIRITYRISLRSSSLWEPRHPPVRVVWHFRFCQNRRSASRSSRSRSFGVQHSLVRPYRFMNWRVDDWGRNRPHIRSGRSFCAAGPKAVDGHFREVPRGVRWVVWKDGYYGNDPSAGSPTETLLRLHLPLNSEV